MEPPEHFPALPSAAANMHWSANIVEAHRTLTSIFNSARASLNLDESDPTRVRFHLTRIVNEVYPILEAVSLQEDEPLSPDLVRSMVLAFSLLFIRLQSALENSQRRSAFSPYYDIYLTDQYKM
jgi:hypothetical protein